MTMTELREAFAAWPPPKGDIDAAFRLLRLLKDPTPITEAWLRELGFRWCDQTSLWWLGGQVKAAVENGECGIVSETTIGLAKTLGQLRGLLLFVGEP